VTLDFGAYSPAAIRRAQEAVTYLSATFAAELGGSLDPFEADLAVALDMSLSDRTVKPRPEGDGLQTRDL
jgi:hypothetical protein